MKKLLNLSPYFRKVKFRKIREGLQKAFSKRTHFPKPPRLGEKITLPGQELEIYRGFVNAQSNPDGLGAQFFTSPDALVAMRWENSKPGHSGYPGLVHGGVSAAILDELMAHAAYVLRGKYSITLNIKLEFFKPIRVGEVVTGSAFKMNKEGRTTKVRAYLFRADGKVAVKSTAIFFLPSFHQFLKLAEVKEESVPKELRSAFLDD